MLSPDEPYALKSTTEQNRRIALLDQPHMAPLSNYLAEIKTDHPRKKLPNFDPCDGGIHAKVLFLQQSPGRFAANSNFISRNNPDQTARNVCNFMNEVEIARHNTIFWNIVPWYIGDDEGVNEVTRHDIEQALPYLAGLIELLPRLKVIALSGQKAQSVKGHVQELTKLPIVDVHLPSATPFNVWPHKKDEYREQLKQILGML